MTSKSDPVVTRSYLDKRLKSFKLELKDELYEIKDDIIKEIKDMREESNMHQYSHIRINDELQDHDKRLRKLETT